MDDLEKKYGTKLKGPVVMLIILAVLLFIFAFFAPAIFVNTARFGLEFSNTGQIGDTIGGLMGPFINLSAVIVTGLAFYMQYKANSLQVQIFKDQLQETKNQFKTDQESQEKQVKLQQFESQFFEMLRLHKSNVDEMSLDFTEWDAALTYHTEIRADKRQAFGEMSRLLYRILAQIFKFGVFEQQDFEAAYKLFFWGYDRKYYQILTGSQGDTQEVDQGLYKLTVSHKGYGHVLAHYFRHLFLMVKFVDESDIVVEYNDKMKYLKILRAQLSNHEQVMIFYNWLCEDYGSAWENENNNFLTKYKMIHNIWYKELYQDNYFINKINYLIDVYNQKQNGTPLFEFQGNNLYYKIPVKVDRPLADEFD